MALERGLILAHAASSICRYVPALSNPIAANRPPASIACARRTLPLDPIEANDEPREHPFGSSFTSQPKTSQALETCGWKKCFSPSLVHDLLISRALVRAQ